MARSYWHDLADHLEDLARNPTQRDATPFVTGRTVFWVLLGVPALAVCFLTTGGVSNAAGLVGIVAVVFGYRWAAETAWRFKLWWDTRDYDIDVREVAHE